MAGGDDGSKGDHNTTPNAPLVPHLPPVLQRVLPRTIPGPVSPQNKGALDWGWQGLVAYGAQTTVAVVDPVTLQCVQTLSRHRSHVVKVRWRKTRHYHQLSAPYSLTLASADVAGTILVWDVTKAEVTATLTDGNKPVHELEWLGGSDGSEHLLAALHPPYALVVWDTRHNTRLWRKSYTETLNTFHFDPFHTNKMAFLCAGGCILFVEDFSLTRCPSSNGRKFYVSAPRASPGRGSNSGQTATAAASDERTSTRIRRKMRELVVGEAKPKGEDGGGPISECLQLAYHRTVRDQLLLVYPREVLILDLAINQTVGIVALDRSASPFTQVWSCWQRDVVFSLHESGSVAAHFRRRLLPPPPQQQQQQHDTAPSDSGVMDGYCEVAYDRKCHSEALRLNRQTRPIGLTLDPVSEKQMAIVLGDGRVVFKQVTPSPSPPSLSTTTTIKAATIPTTPLFTPGAPSAPLPGTTTTTTNNPNHHPTTTPAPDLNIADNHFASPMANASTGSANTANPANPKTSLADLVKPAWALAENVKDQGHRISLRILMTGLMPAVAPPPLVIRSCPPLTTRNLDHYVPRLAAGTHAGLVQIFNLATGRMDREFALHTYPVRGVEWTSLTSLVSFGHQPLTNSQGLVRNELVYTDILTGRSVMLRPNKSDETSIDMVRVSYLKQYFIVVFRDDPFELWDARKLVPLRTMPRRFPRVTALEWSPTSHVKARLDSQTDSQDSISRSDVCGTGSNLSSPQTESSMTDSLLSLADVGGDRGGSIAKETFVFTDTEGQLYHFSVEGNVIKDGTKVPPDSQLSSISSVAWKSHEIVLGDSEGSLTVWDLKTRVSRHIATHRGWVKKVRFAPGRDNMKLLVLFADGVDIWDVREVLLVSQLRCPGDGVKVVDGDWGASDRPVLATADGCIRVLDLNLSTSASTLTSYCSQESVVSPYLLPSEASLNLRTLLTHQPWRHKYSLSFSLQDGFSPDHLNMVEQWIQRLGTDVREFLEGCQSTGRRALTTARLFGDQGELDFWTVACHYLASTPSLLACKDDNSSSSSSSSVGSAELINLTDAASEKSDDSTQQQQQHLPPHPLETTYHNLCDSATYKHHELERLAIQESKNLEGSQRAALGRSLAMAGERDRAVRLLLDADASHTHFYTDCLRACLLAATNHSPQAQSTIKLVATNLIAAGNVWEGVELLCLIGKAGDACRYLQSYGQWQQSVWLAKCALSTTEASDILKRWAQHLITTGNKDQGVCVLLSIGHFSAAIEQLVQQHYHQRAALLLAAAQEAGALPTTHTLRPPHHTQGGHGSQTPHQGVHSSQNQGVHSSQNQGVHSSQNQNQDVHSSSQNQTQDSQTSEKSSDGGNAASPPQQQQPASSFASTSTQGLSPLLASSSSLASLAENIHRKYVLHLFSLGNHPAVSHYCRLLGEKGRTLLQELDSLQ